jgi:hypothetical protein
VVVLPTPPFWLAIAIILAIYVGRAVNWRLKLTQKSGLTGANWPDWRVFSGCFTCPNPKTVSRGTRETSLNCLTGGSYTNEEGGKRRWRHTGYVPSLTKGLGLYTFQALDHFMGKATQPPETQVDRYGRFVMIV